MKEAIILAGGMGTRLQSVVNNVPKPMADINGRPFLEFLLTYLADQGIKRIVLSVGYMHEVITTYFGSTFLGMNLCYAIEKEPLGTGGALINSLSLISSEDVVVLNGDSFFPINLDDLYTFHDSKDSSFSIALKHMDDASRYGRVEIDNNGCIVGFTEKKEGVQGAINAGIYLIKASYLTSCKAPEKFSIEKEFMETCYGNGRFYGKVFDSFFIDIGVPEDYLEFARLVANGAFGK